MISSEVGFHPVLTIPSGATNIWVEDDSPLHLALRNSDQRMIVNGVYGEDQQEDGFILMSGEDSGSVFIHNLLLSSSPHTGVITS